MWRFAAWRERRARRAHVRERACCGPAIAAFFERAGATLHAEEVRFAAPPARCTLEG